MKRLIASAIFVLMIGLTITGTASATTYYIAANGADTNSGATKMTPWLHAPGMPNCSNTCASYTPQAGDSFIFRGGDTWHTQNVSTTVYMGSGQWNWTWSGSAANCNYPTTTSSCIYIGVDQTYYTGGSWVRPAIDMDNPTSTSLVASCTYDQSSTPGAIQIGNGSGYPNNTVSYVILDNFEFYGHCHSGGNPDTSYVKASGTYLAIIDCYFHGWTETNGAWDQSPLISNYYVNGEGLVNNGATHAVAAYNVFDGSDSFCTGQNACTGEASNFGYDFNHNVVRYIANALNGAPNIALIHDNLFEDMFSSFGCSGMYPASCSHTAVAEQNGNDLAQPMQWYNNIFRNMNVGEVLNPNASNRSPLYLFNNIFSNSANGGNCVAMAATNSATSESAYIVNNTFDYGSIDCMIRLTPGGSPGPFQGTIYFQNNHFIGYSPATLIGVVGGSVPGGITLASITGSYTDVFQTEAVANAQGYTASNNYQPTSTSDATYHAGASLSSYCSTFSADSDLCDGTTGGVTDAAGAGIIPALYIPLSPSRIPAWDAGAYEFGSGSSSQPVAPTDLVATAQ